MGSVAELRLAELQHRVLGNFHLLHALIAIRLRSVSDPESRRHLGWVSDIVAALGLLNRRLAEGRMDDFAEYLEEVVGFWRRVCAGRSLELELEADSVRLDETLATSLAIIVHELLAGAIGHALPGGRPARVTVRLAGSHGPLTLTVADDRDEDAEVAEEGLNLARGLAEHLGGALTVDRRGGFAATISLPKAGLPAGAAH